MKWIVVWLGAAILTSCATSSTDFFSGQITYQVTPEGDGKNSADAYEVTEYVQGDQVRTDQPTSMGMQTSIFNAKDSSHIVLLDFADKKAAITVPKSDVSRLPAITYTRKTRKIAGYKCKLALVVYPNGDTVQVHYTRAIPAHLSQKFEGLKGYPLAHTIIAQGRSMLQEAVELTHKELPDSIFIVPEEYVHMTLEEFQNSLGR